MAKNWKFGELLVVKDSKSGSIYSAKTEHQFDVQQVYAELKETLEHLREKTASVHIRALHERECDVLVTPVHGEPDDYYVQIGPKSWGEKARQEGARMSEATRQARWSKIRIVRTPLATEPKKVGREVPTATYVKWVNGAIAPMVNVVPKLPVIKFGKRPEVMHLKFGAH